MQTRRFNPPHQDRYVSVATDGLIDAANIPPALSSGDELWGVKIVKQNLIIHLTQLRSGAGMA